MLRRALRGSTFSGMGMCAGMPNVTSKQGGMQGATGDWWDLGAQAIDAATQIASYYAPTPTAQTTVQPQPQVVYVQQPAAAAAAAPAAGSNTVLYVALAVAAAGGLYLALKD